MTEGKGTTERRSRMTSLYNGDKTVPRVGHVRTLLTRDFDGWGGGVTARCWPAADASSTAEHHHRASKAQTPQFARQN